MDKIVGLLPFAALLAVSCTKQAPSEERRLPAGSVALEVDEVRLFVPIAWNAGRPWDSRPWPNGLQISTGGWGHFTPWLGPIEGAERLAPGEIYRAKSAGQRPDSRETFFNLRVTFEFPPPLLPRMTWKPRRDRLFFPLSLDRLTLRYRAPAEDVEQPYMNLLAGLRRDQGQDVGDGWREVRRRFADREVILRFDAADWHSRGGLLPPRMAATFRSRRWTHFSKLDQPRWTTEFETLDLPVEQWRDRYLIAEELFAWLQTPPGSRDETRRFRWWQDLRLRPAK